MVVSFEHGVRVFFYRAEGDKPEDATDTGMCNETASDMVGTKPVTPQMDMNMYATRKTIAQDVLLNSSQHKFFEVTIALITLSIILQIIVGIVFILLGRLNINFFVNRKKADLLNNVSVIQIFLITVVNVLISVFGPSDSVGGQPQQPTAWANFYHGKLPDDCTK